MHAMIFFCKNAWNEDFLSIEPPVQWLPIILHNDIFPDKSPWQSVRRGQFLQTEAQPSTHLYSACRVSPSSSCWWWLLAPTTPTTTTSPSTPGSTGGPTPATTQPSTPPTTPTFTPLCRYSSSRVMTSLAMANQLCKLCKSRYCPQTPPAASRSRPPTPAYPPCW